MKFSLVNGQRQEAQPHLSGRCPTCDHPMVAKCGIVKVRHWAHQGIRHCDPWWENETEWHRAWKAHFPDNWQEVTSHAESGEKHIADVRTDQGWVLEFQHSYLSPDERLARETFYPKLVWIVDGARRKRDKPLFLEALDGGLRVSENPWIWNVFPSEGGALLRDWVDSRATVLLDFGRSDDPKEAALWCLLRGNLNENIYVAALSRDGFIALHRNGATQINQDFVGALEDLNKKIMQYESLRDRRLNQPVSPMSFGFMAYRTRRDGRRRRF